MPQSPSEIARIKRAVRERDGMRCTKCGMSHGQHLLAHGRAHDVHRTTPGSLYTLEGCVTLCRPCHVAQHPEKSLAPDQATGKRRVFLGDWLPVMRALAAKAGRSVSQHLVALVERDAKAKGVQTPSTS